MSLQVNVGSTALGDDDYETVLRPRGKAEIKRRDAVRLRFSYAGVFRLQNIPQEHIHPVLVIDCARLLFPFARQIIAEAVQNGGFPPFYVPPIDFAALFQQRLQEPRASRAPRPTDRAPWSYDEGPGGPFLRLLRLIVVLAEQQPLSLSM